MIKLPQAYFAINKVDVPAIGAVMKYQGTDVMCTGFEYSPHMVNVQAITGGLTFGRLAAYNAVRTHVAYKTPVKAWTPKQWWWRMHDEFNELVEAFDKADELSLYPQDKEEFAEAIKEVGSEVADVVTLLDLFCQSLGLSLEDVIKAKFNEVNRRPKVNFKGDL